MWMANHDVQEMAQCAFCNNGIPEGMSSYFRCAHCSTQYCSKEHKKADFRFHKARCQGYANFTQQNDPVRLSAPISTQQYVPRNDDFSGFLACQQNASQFSLKSLPDQKQSVSAMSPLKVQTTSNLTQVEANSLGSQLNPNYQYHQPNPIQTNSSVDNYNNISPISGQSSPTDPSAKLGASSVRFQVNPIEQDFNNCQYYQQPLNQSNPYLPQSSEPTQTVTIQNAPIQIQDTNVSNEDDSIPLDDALLSFLQEAEQYDSPAEETQNSNQGKLPRNLSGIIRDLTKQTEENLFYDELLSSVDSSDSEGVNSRKQSGSELPSTSVMMPEFSPIMCEQFEFQKQNSKDIIEGKTTVEEEGVFKRFNINVIADFVVKSLNGYNHCIIDFLHGLSLANAILEDVKMFHTEEGFSEGRLSNLEDKKGTPNRAVREDLVAWTDGKGRKAIQKHMSRMDFLLKLCNKYITDVEISSRTQAMVACYPGKATGYKQHVDNPNKDGRCITTLYYLNPTWNVETDGGILRLFPGGIRRKTVNVEPLFDRLLFFWSDRRTPHEVTPAFKPRYAITLWYFNDEERKKYIKRYREGKAAKT
ncbi:hypoxia-inducible factor prolyl hydroxylase [Exaiptasia diaphana]|uniref:hypoxia-inducible factor-proline dioxygenase n=1 Tax=Exaiptasia diaphana TaxID=2652724 RepID=A0A913WWB4_EXADI|nr:hypoxia-inducible factor prolyl hydroxylase [Exaiptasia diaphana]